MNYSPEYWMIEKSIDGVAHWWVRTNGQNEYWDLPHRWTTDSSKARHYKSKYDAEYVIGADMVGCVEVKLEKEKIVKVYRVTTERDGEHHKEGHVSVTKIAREQKYIAAYNLEVLLDYIRCERNDAESAIIGIEEVIASIQMPSLYTENE